METTVPPSIATTEETTSSTSSSTTEAPTDGPHATFLYPTGLATINNIDTVQVTYDTVWKNANLTLLCGINEESNEWAMATMNFLQPDGTYAIAPIQAGMDIPQFPVYCYMMLYDSYNGTDSTTGGSFTMACTTGPASIYAMTVTTPAPTSRKPTSNSDAGTPTPTPTQSQTDSARTTVLTGAAAVSSSTGSAPTETAISSTPSSSGLSGGAKAGIAVGVIIGVCALVAAVLLFLRTRRRQAGGTGNMVKVPSTASAERVALAEKPAGAAAAAAAPTTVEVPEPPVLKAPANHRNSEDWRRFFGNGTNPKSEVSS
ncbi:uncharacterized protein Z518_07009 [Rhinocladiella mackenziei CBS 650.93]|uniref:Mid2 domain-containing protein n=1 Tax=Rhinocladiella mackenziei CBS 650.93 TaxID=1442369 RepID=A0A0D2FN33_9EURO|nr:uncharacterized protein Z518_07009 [Rhinocladiella mackenziei CBS 650.93]KIX03457.1 hypothetical protein Z518_07009 [Rhinocladiella mackenziei CBS 650.93]